MKNNKTILFLVYAILGLYTINHKVQFIKIPESIFNLHGWIIFVAGLFLIYSAVRYLMVPRRPIYR